MKTAFIGFRHMHIFDVYRIMLNREDIEIVAACEEDPGVSNKISREKEITLTYNSFELMLGQVDFDLLVVGDYFAKRGGLIMRALEAGKHVLSDKPICTKLIELDAIETLARKKKRAVGAILELRDSGIFLKIRELIRTGEIGDILAISFSGQHPLLLNSRPSWYFEPGKHGGTINDLSIHGVDILTWITGKAFTQVTAARCWNAALPQFPAFHNAAQLMLIMEGGCGVIGDVSYFSPDSFAYSLPQYWRFTFWGERGVIEAGLNDREVLLYRADSREVSRLSAAASRTGGFVDDLLQKRQEDSKRENGNSALLRATYLCLKAQEAADKDLCPLPL